MREKFDIVAAVVYSSLMSYKRKTDGDAGEDDNTSKVFVYGLLRPTENLELVLSQMRASAKYRNKLIEAERAMRLAQDDIVQADTIVALADEVAKDALANVENLVGRLNALRQQTGGYSETEEDKATIRAARTVSKSALADLTSAKYAAMRGNAVELKEIQGRAYGYQKELRRQKNCGVYWGTSQLQDKAMMASAKTPPYTVRTGRDVWVPRFQRWDGHGRVGVQVQNGTALAAVFGGQSTLALVDPVPGAAWDPAVPRGERKRLSRTTLRLRIGTVEGKKTPIWATFPMIMHRPMPRDSVITRVSVVRSMVGPRDCWEVHFTVKTQLPSEPHGDGVVALDLGWRLMPDGSIRIGKWRGADGESGEIRLSEDGVSAITKAESLQAIRGRNFAATVDQLSAWLKTHEVPEWLSEATKTLGLWKSPGRLARLAKDWLKKPFPAEVWGDGTYLDAWRYHDEHLWRWETSQRTKALNARRETYRIFAASLARRYGVLVLEDFDLSRIATAPNPEDDSGDNPNARRSRVLSSPGDLRRCLRLAFLARHGKVVLVKPQNTSKRCSLCGAVGTWKKPSEVWHVCEACLGGFDRDDNATYNLLYLYLNSPELTAWSLLPGPGERTGTKEIDRKGKVRETLAAE